MKGPYEPANQRLLILQGHTPRDPENRYDFPKVPQPVNHTLRIEFRSLFPFGCLAVQPNMQYSELFILTARIALLAMFQIHAGSVLY